MTDVSPRESLLSGERSADCDCGCPNENFAGHVCTDYTPPSHRGRCDACGKRRMVAYLGWHDEGSPMLTCAECGGLE